MKSLKVILLFAAITLCSTAKAQKTYLLPNETPSKILNFIQSNFPTHKILTIQRDKKGAKTEYEANLDPMVELEFDGNSNIKEIETEAGIPASAVPDRILKYVVKKYPGERVIKWEKEVNSQKVVLVGGQKLYFDLRGKFLRVGN